MGDSIHQDRPAKRLKMSPQMAQQPLHSHAHPRAHSHPHLFRPGDVAPLPADVNAFAAAGNAQAMADPWAAANSQLFDSSWKWPATSAPTSSRTTASPAMPGLTGLPGSDRPNGTWPAPPSSITTTTFVASSASPADFDLLSPTASSYSIPPTPPRLARLLPAVSGDIVPPAAPQHHSQHRRRTRSKVALVSPFKDCLNKFGDYAAPRFPRPQDGKVNGYIKFNWPKKPRSGDRSASVSVVEDVTDLPDGVESSQMSQSSQLSQSTVAESFASSVALSPPASTGIVIPPTNGDIIPNFAMASEFDQFLNGPQIYPGYRFPQSSTSPILSPLTPDMLATTGGPRMVPPQFGHGAKMDQMDRRFWTFYVFNWCPGRSVLQETNLWLKDFAQMEESDGVRAAIQSLAGIYIYDYQPMDAIRKRVNERFSDAEERLSFLLSDPTTLTKAQAGELITIAALLSMQDVVLTERRLQKPYHPRWLQGFKQAEQILHMFDEGSRFWNPTNIQLPSLQISQSIIVGRAVILAQPLMALPSPTSFDPEQDASRFGWLLYGSGQDMFEIHGGCGFSKKLLHTMSQITYCAARLQQDRESIMVPVTAQFVLEQLLEMRQWSSESMNWELAKVGPPIIDWVRGLSHGYKLDTPGDMTDVTAEAWRFAAILYLQCRVMRLPRNHPEVLAYMTDLAQCIRIMPTSGPCFTAQAPLFPVFLLGLLATDPDHKMVAMAWFEEVVQTPVRSSVPPLYDALKRIWSWIDVDVELPPAVGADLPDSIGLRRAWWERMVAKVHEKEQEILCLT